MLPHVVTACGQATKRQTIELEGDAETMAYNIERMRHQDASEVGPRAQAERAVGGLYLAA